MNIESSEMLKQLMSLKTEKDVETFINEYGKDWKWRPIGKKENAGIIDMGSEPSDALAERVTNGMDALIERKYFELGEPKDTPKSPRESAEKWFNIISGDLTNLTDDQRRNLAKNLIITLLESGEDEYKNPKQWQDAKYTPTIEINDKGIGQHPDDFEKTFLSLNENNKIGKHYLIGAFGQGGSTVYGFGNYSIVISRKPPNLLKKEQIDSIGWSIVRRNERNYEDYKKAIYEYCLSPNDTVMRFPSSVLDYEFEGAVVRLIQFELPQESTIYTAPTGSLWWASHHCLFDPIMPFLICDKRRKRFPSLTEADGTNGRVINGNSFRLNSIDKKTGTKKFVSNSWEIPLEDVDGGKIKVIWWICEDKKEVENYVNRSNPIIITFNGQRQIFISKSELNLKGRDFIKDRLIIQIVGDNLSPIGQRIFSSTRDRARKNNIFIEIISRLKRALLVDEDLKKLDEELRAKTLVQEISDQEKKAMELLARLLERQEKIDEKAQKTLSDDIFLPVTTAPKDENEEAEEEKEEKEEKIQLVPEIDLHNVPTTLQILNVRQPIPLEKGYGATLRLFLDVVDDYFTRDAENRKLTLEFQRPELILEKARSNIRKGKISIRLEPNPESRTGTKCEAKIIVNRPNDAPLVTTTIFEITGAKKRWRLNTGKKQEHKPKAPEIRYVNRNDEAWKTLSWDENDVAEFKDGIVFVSTVNKDVEPCLKSIKGEETLKRYICRYGAHIALFTIMQKKHEDNMKTTLPEGYRKSEMQRAARSIINAVAINIEELEPTY